jgi:fructose/tagatose bisphosphate aldolase
MTPVETLSNTSSNSTEATLCDVLTSFEKQRAALGHFNVADLVLLKAVVAAAAETNLPVLIGASEGEREFFGTRQLATVVKSEREETDLPLFLNDQFSDCVIDFWRQQKKLPMRWNHCTAQSSK